MIDAHLDQPDVGGALTNAATVRVRLLHREHVLHELIDGDLGALVEA